MNAANRVSVLQVCLSIKPITFVQINHISSLFLVTEDDYYVEERSKKRHRRSNSIRSRSRSIDRDESSHGGRSISSADRSTSRHRRGYSRERSASTHEDSDHRRHLRKNHRYYSSNSSTNSQTNRSAHRVSPQSAEKDRLSRRNESTMARRRTPKTRSTRRTAGTVAQETGPEAQVAAAAAAAVPPVEAALVFATPQEEIAHLFANPGRTPEESAAIHARVTELLAATEAATAANPPRAAANPPTAAASRASSAQIAPQNGAISSQNGANAVNAPLYVEEHKKYLMTALKEKIWRTQCFILSDEDAVAFGVDLCVASNFDKWGATYIPDKTRTNEVIVAYAERNQKALCGLLNELRNSVSGKLKQVAYDWLDDIDFNNQKKLRSDDPEVKASVEAVRLPDLEELMKIITRADDLDDDLFMWWWDDVLPQVAGNANQWSDKIRYYTPISKHRPILANGQLAHLRECYVSPSLEAFAYFCFDNNYIRWHTTWAIKQKHKENQKIVKNWAKYDHPVSEYFPFIKVYPKNCLYIGSEERQDGAIPFPVRTKYTETNAGQKVKGGFKTTGSTKQ